MITKTWQVSIKSSNYKLVLLGVVRLYSWINVFFFARRKEPILFAYIAAQSFFCMQISCISFHKRNKRFVLSAPVRQKQVTIIFCIR